jgi:hypothetical protein
VYKKVGTTYCGPKPAVLSSSQSRGVCEIRLVFAWLPLFAGGAIPPFFGFVSQFSRVVRNCARISGRAACGGLRQFGRAKPFCTFLAGRIIRLRVWRHVGCSQYQESTARGGKGHPIRASCSGIGLFFGHDSCDRQSGRRQPCSGAWRETHDSHSVHRVQYRAMAAQGGTAASWLLPGVRQTPGRDGRNRRSFRRFTQI